MRISATRADRRGSGVLSLRRYAGVSVVRG
jgi:hypothetical protein